uniref:Uncharacterized protein n=1 Tax=Setaria italica TaxID=4555 RepID=K3YKS2_SETIT
MFIFMRDIISNMSQTNYQHFWITDLCTNIFFIHIQGAKGANKRIIYQSAN